MAEPAYSTIQGIREEAGLQQRWEREAPASGAANGSNTVFIAQRSPFVDTNGDDAITIADVVAYVNGAPVTIASINAAAGSVTLQAAPANGATVELTYATSPASDSYVDSLLDEAVSWVKSKIQTKVSLPFTDVNGTNPLPDMIKTVTRLYAGALMLIRDYGSSSDTDQTSKDGYQKLKTARELLDDYINGLTEANESSTAAEASQVAVKTDGNIFERNEDLDNTYPSSPPQDDYFMRRE